MKIFASFYFLILFCSCNDDLKKPDVSGMKVSLTVQRFERDLFVDDTTGFQKRLDATIAKYPGFGENFLSAILGLDPKWPADTTVGYVKAFINYNRNVYDTAQKIFPDFDKPRKELEQAVRYVKHYFPAYKVPSKIITYIGPVDGYGDILDDDVFIVGLQAHLGADFPLYKTSAVNEIYPEYLTQRFTPDYISVNCMRNIIDDMYPEKNDDKTLLIKMVDKGKKLFLLSKFLPDTKEYMLIGYTNQQLKDSYNHEAQIWNLFTQNNFLQTGDNNLIKNYLTEGPKTQELGEGAPGNIGSFAGWQIVKKYMNKFPDTTPDQLMKTDNETLFAAAKYKP